MTDDVLLSEEQVQELIRCEADPFYFVQHYVWLEEKETQRILPFEPYEFQTKILKALRDGENVLVYKQARRAGGSWIVATFAAWLINFHKGVKVLFLSKTEKDAIALLDKVKFVLKNLARHDNADHLLATKASWLCGHIETDNQQLFSIGYRDDEGHVVAESEAASLTTTTSAGRSEGASLIFLDEFAFVKPDDEATWTAIKPTVARGGQWAMVSTPNGAGGVFHRLVMQALRHENEHYRLVIVTREDAHITEEQYEAAIEGMSDEGIRQEWAGEFIQSGNPVFNATDLAACYKLPDEYPEVAAALEEYRVKVGFYYSGVDTARGKVHRKSSDKDYHSWCSLTKNGIQAYAFHSKEPLSKWAGHTEFMQDGREVNVKGTTTKLHAQFPGTVSIEENDAGATTCDRHQVPQDNVSSVVFFDTKGPSKARIINRLVLSIEGHTLIITDRFTYDCLLVYQHGDQPGTFNAQSGMFDDPVMSLALSNDLRYEYGDLEFAIPIGAKRASTNAEAMEEANIAQTPFGPDTLPMDTDMRMGELFPMPQVARPGGPSAFDEPSPNLDFTGEPGSKRRGNMFSTRM